MASGRRTTRGARRADAIFGYAIPLFLILLAGYQQIKLGAVDKYVLGGLLIFGLGALGWRLDVLFDSYMRMRYGQSQVTPKEENNIDKRGSSDAD